MEPVSLYSKNYKVEIKDVDFDGKLKLSSLFTKFQDVAGLHSENLSMGIKTLYENYGVLWVLARIRVDILRQPLLDDEIIIETWPQEPDSIRFSRDFLVKDRQDNILIRAVSTWVVIDINTRRLVKTESVYSGYPPVIEKRAINCKLKGLISKGELEQVYKRKVRYSDIDVNKHLNNAKYIEFIMDSFDKEFHIKYRIKSIEVNYSNEALLGDTIKIYRDKLNSNSNTIYIEGINEKNNKLVFKSQLEVDEK